MNQGDSEESVKAATASVTGEPASLVTVSEQDFLPGAGYIDFTEFPLGTWKPVYSPSDYNGGPGSPTVTVLIGFISWDAAVDAPAVLSVPASGMISFSFSPPQAGVGFAIGYLNALGSVQVSALTAENQMLRQIVSSTLDTEFVGFATSDGSAAIGSIIVCAIANEPYGYSLFNLHFASTGQVTLPGEGTAGDA